MVDVDLARKIKEHFLFFDGSMGSRLMALGLKPGEEPSFYNVEKPEIIKSVHRGYLEAGADIITTNTFGANGIKLKDAGYTVETIVASAVKLAKEAIGEEKGKYVALDIGPTGKLMAPIGDLAFEEAYQFFKEVIIHGSGAGADLILIETMSDVLEVKAAILAAKENCDLPVFVTMTFQEDGRTLNGTDPETMVNILESLGVDALGVNCSLGPDEMKPVILEILKYANRPVMIQPNAGIPKLRGGQTIYDVRAEDFAATMGTFAEAGVRIFGGCCGTDETFIRLMKENIQPLQPKTIDKKPRTTACSSTKTVDFDRGVVIIGERINPTGKPVLKKSLVAGSSELALREAVKQKECGAEVIDVNVSGKSIDEMVMLPKLVKDFEGVVDMPLQLDNTTPEVLEAALRIYSGKPIINSVNGKQSSMDAIFPLVKKYGTMVIGLTMDENGLPETVEDRVNIARKIIEEGAKYGIGKENFLIDCLTLSAASDSRSAIDTFDALRRIKGELGVKTTLGASNVSFGLPNRDILNGIYLTMAFTNGLDAPITDPTIQEIRNAFYGYRFFVDNEKEGDTFLNEYGKVEHIAVKDTLGSLALKELVIAGLKEESLNKTKELLETIEPEALINDHLIAALDVVGKQFEKGEIFLPQLLRSAEAVKESFEAVKHKMATRSVEVKKGHPVILATVEGDVHDIGKNIVKILLENYGFDVLDLGKDVKPELIVETAKKHSITLIGLSALMTTTVPSMEKTIKLLREEGLDCKVVVGGAVLSQSFADEIGADHYAKDARETVRIAQEHYR